MKNLKKKKNWEKNKKLRTIGLKKHESFEKSKPRVEFYWFL